MSSERKINSVAKNISTGKAPERMKNAALFCINTYKGTKYDLGDGPMNDGYHMAKVVNEYGYDVYYLLNPGKAKFMKKLKEFLIKTEGRLVIFYVGHGTNVRDVSGDEDDGYDEAMIFVDGHIIDDDLLDTLVANKNPSSYVSLLTDACHSGLIWDLQNKHHRRVKLPPKIVSISAATDKQTAKQTVVERLDQGMFSYNMRKVLRANRNIIPMALKKSMATALSKYQQTVTVCSTSDDILSMPVFG